MDIGQLSAEEDREGRGVEWPPPHNMLAAGTDLPDHTTAGQIATAAAGRPNGRQRTMEQHQMDLERSVHQSLAKRRQCISENIKCNNN